MDKEKILQRLNQLNKNTLMETLDIKFIDIGENFLTAKMPVNSKVHQPFGLLHGGATAALAETVGSAASQCSLIDVKTKITVGLELNISRIKGKKKGILYAKATVIHKGKTTHLWEIKIIDEKNDLISVCKLTNIVLDKQ